MRTSIEIAKISHPRYDDATSYREFDITLFKQFTKLALVFITILTLDMMMPAIESFTLG